MPGRLSSLIEAAFVVEESLVPRQEVLDVRIRSHFLGNPDQLRTEGWNHQQRVQVLIY